MIIYFSIVQCIVHKFSVGIPDGERQEVIDIGHFIAVRN